MTSSCFTPVMMPLRAVLAPPPPCPRDADHPHQFSRRANVPRRARRAATNPPNSVSRPSTRTPPNEPLPIDNFLADVKPPRRTSPSDDGILDSTEVVSLAFSRGNLTNLDNESQSSLTHPSLLFVPDQPRHLFSPSNDHFPSHSINPPPADLSRARENESQISVDDPISQLFDRPRGSAATANNYSPQSVKYRSTAPYTPQPVISDEERRARRRAQRDLVYAYNLQLKQLTRKRDLNGCLAVMEEMRAKGAKPDAYSYSTVLSCCSRLKATETAFHLYGRMLVERVRLDEHVLVTVMNIAGRANPPNLDLLRALFHQASAPSRVMCNVFIEGLANAGLIDDVEGVVRYMKLRGITIDGYTSAGIAKAYVRSGEPEAALERLTELQKSGVVVPPYAFNTVMSGYSSAGDVESTRKVFDMLGRRGRTQVSYNVMIAVYSSASPPDMAKAFDVFEFMLREGRCTGDRYTGHALMKVCIAAGDGAMAYATYAAMKSNRWMPNQVSYRLAATAAAMTRDGLAVAEIADDAASNGARLRRDSAIMLVVAALRAGEMDTALRYALDFIAQKRERRHAQDFFDEVREQLLRFDGPAMLIDGTGIEVQDVVRDLVAAWRLATWRK